MRLYPHCQIAGAPDVDCTAGTAGHDLDVARHPRNLPQQG
jgi:hypothetical protein